MEHPLAMIQAMDVPTGSRRARDKDLRFARVRSKPRSQPEFLPARSIRRGAAVVPTGDNYVDYYVVDLLDGDMFLRVEDIFPGYVGILNLQNTY